MKTTNAATANRRERTMGVRADRRTLLPGGKPGFREPSPPGARATKAARRKARRKARRDADIEDDDQRLLRIRPGARL